MGVFNFIVIPQLVAASILGALNFLTANLFMPLIGGFDDSAGLFQPLTNQNYNK
jgi:hypothetical protein